MPGGGASPMREPGGNTTSAACAGESSASRTRSKAHEKAHEIVCGIVGSFICVPYAMLWRRTMAALATIVTSYGPLEKSAIPPFVQPHHQRQSKPGAVPAQPSREQLRGTYQQLR